MEQRTTTEASVRSRKMDPKEMVGQKIHDPDGDAIGTVERLVLDHLTGDAEWLGVTLEGEGRLVAIPLGGIEVRDSGLTFFERRDFVAAAPQVEVGETLESEVEALLYDHYGLQRPYIKERADAMGVEFTSEGAMLIPRGLAGEVTPPRPEGYPEDEWDIAYGSDPGMDFNKAFAMAYDRLSHVGVQDGEVVKIGWTGGGIPHGGGGLYVVLAQRQSSAQEYAVGRGEVDDLAEEGPGTAAG